MGIFNSILAKLGFGDKKTPAPANTDDLGLGASHSPLPSGTSSEIPPLPPSAPPPGAPRPVAFVDVVAQLEQRARATPEKLNWRTSIVDLMKLLGLDSSFAARKELAAELGCPPDKMGDSAQMNMWLHKTVLQKLADNGGNVPAELLH